MFDVLSDDCSCHTARLLQSHDICAYLICFERLACTPGLLKKAAAKQYKDNKSKSESKGPLLSCGAAVKYVGV